MCTISSAPMLPCGDSKDSTLIYFFRVAPWLLHRTPQSPWNALSRYPLCTMHWRTGDGPFKGGGTALPQASGPWWQAPFPISITRLDLPPVRVSLCRHTHMHVCIHLHHGFVHYAPEWHSTCGFAQALCSACAAVALSASRSLSPLLPPLFLLFCAILCTSQCEGSSGGGAAQKGHGAIQLGSLSLFWIASSSSSPKISKSLQVLFSNKRR